MPHSSSDDIKAIVTIILCGTLGSVAVELIVFGRTALNFNSMAFQFVVLGFLASALFSLVLFNRLRDAIFAFLLILALDLMFIGGKFWITHVLYFLSVGASIYVFQHYLFRRMERMLYFRPVLLGIVLAMAFLLDTLILSWIYLKPGSGVALFRNMPVGLLIGLRVGAGAEAALYLILKENNIASI